MILGRGTLTGSFALLLVCLAFAPSAAAQGDAACKDALALQQRTELDSARAEYDKLLAQSPVPACALSHSAEVSKLKAAEAAQCDRGKAGDEAGQADLADEAYAEALRINVESACGKAGLT